MVLKVVCKSGCDFVCEGCDGWIIVLDLFVVL